VREGNVHIHPFHTRTHTDRVGVLNVLHSILLIYFFCRAYTQDDDDNADPGCSEGRAASLIPAAGQPAAPLDSCSWICPDTPPTHHCSIEQLMSLLTGDE